MMVGGLRELTRGAISREGEPSREEAVLDPPGDSMEGPHTHSSVGIIRESPVADALLITGRGLCLMAGELGGTLNLGAE